MGEVYQAKDRQTGSIVALKVVSDAIEAFSGERFEREITLLAELHHPGIVPYVAHGRLPDGDPFLVMDWLSGVRLSERLARGRLSIEECVGILRQAADALAEAHRRGIIHRDIKPENIFLRDGRLDQIVLLDFGVARRASDDGALTIEGMLVGTPQYMAPEQARGEVTIGPAVDIFALGCVIFECISGRPTFSAAHLVAVLTKILLDECPVVSELRRDIPKDLADLIQRMLSKNPERRPADAVALQGEIAKLEPIPPSTGRGAAEPTSSKTLTPLTAGEQRLVSVVIASERRAPFEAREPDGAPPSPASMSDADRHQLLDDLKDFAARAEWLADGTLVATLTRSSGSAVDLISLAARFALGVKERWADANVVLATGRGIFRRTEPAMGEAVERAVTLMRACTASSRARAAREPPPAGVWLDDVSSSLLGGRFVQEQAAGGVLVLGERATVDESRLLLGKPTPCVGRDLEIGPLEALFVGSAKGSVARAVLITAAAGMGKSRVRRELTRRLVSLVPSLKVLIGHGDPLRALSPYGILSEALRQRFGVHTSAPKAEQWERLVKALPRGVGSTEARRLSGFLGELCGIHFPDEMSAPLRAARLEPKVLGEEIHRAFLDWLKLECAEAPVLLILEDLQWGDSLTIQLVADATRELSDLPLMVLCVARPEVAAMLPTSVHWLAQQVTLGPLSKKACERLIREVTGRELSADALARIYQQSEGNALFLEELIRAEVEGTREQAPETLILMLQARLLRLDQGARRVLRAASVFGRTFWRGGVLRVHGGSEHDVDGWLKVLVTEEIIEVAKQSRFPNEVEYRFRHALLREAVYRLLMEEDRRTGHARAAEYLEEKGEADPMLIAEHASLGGDKERALRWYLCAATLSWEINDVDGILARVERCIACDAAGEALGVARALACYGHLGKMEMAECASTGLSAIALLPPGSRWWYRAMVRLFFVLPHAGQRDRMNELRELFLKTEPKDDAIADYATAAASTATMLALVGARSDATSFFDHLREPRLRAVVDRDPVARRSVKTNYGWYTRALEPEPYLTMELARESDAACEETNSPYHMCLSKLLLGLSEVDLGDLVEGERKLRRSLELAAITRDPFLLVNAWDFLALCLAERPEPELQDEAIRLAECVLEANEGSFFLGYAHMAKAAALLAKKRVVDAEHSALKGAEPLAWSPPYALRNTVVLIQARLAQGNVVDALSAADEGLRTLRSLGGAGFAEIPLLEAVVHAKLAAGDDAAADQALRDAVLQIEVRALKIPAPTWRERFLRGRPENVRVAALAAERLR